MAPKMLTCSGSFFCRVCGCQVPSVLMADPETQKKWRQCMRCDTPEDGSQILKEENQNVEKE